MKKKQKYYPVNKQEDEDGYASHAAGNAIITKMEKVKQRINSRNTIVSAGLGAGQLQFRSLSLRFR